MYPLGFGIAAIAAAVRVRALIHTVAAVAVTITATIGCYVRTVGETDSSPQYTAFHKNRANHPPF